MGTDLILPGGNSKGQPVAALYSSYVTYWPSLNLGGFARSFSDAFSAQDDVNAGTLTCLKGGKYRISAGIRARFGYFYVYVNDVQKLFVNGRDLGVFATGQVLGEVELELKPGDVIKATTTYAGQTNGYSLCYANIFKA